MDGLHGFASRRKQPSPASPCASRSCCGRARRCPDSGASAASAGSPQSAWTPGPTTKPKVTVVSMAWFEYVALSAWRPARRPRRVPVGELAIGESEPDGQTPASAETRLVLPATSGHGRPSGRTSAGVRLKLVMRDLGSRGGGQLLTEIASCASRQRPTVTLFDHSGFAALQTRSSFLGSVAIDGARSGRPGSLLTLAPGRRRRSPASGSHRTERADFPHSALRKLIHSTASACSSRCGRRKRGRCNGCLAFIW